MTVVEINGIRVWKGWFDRPRQETLLAQVREVARVHPPVNYATRRGRMSVAMTAAGALGWTSDRRGYRYATGREGREWAPIPPLALDAWRTLAQVDRLPDSCLVNHYREGARMGMHQDRDEADTAWPVLSISLGDPALFRVGGTEAPTPSRSLWLESGDVAIIAGAARLAYHGIDRIKFGQSDLLEGGGRINLTLRVAGD